MSFALTDYDLRNREKLLISLEEKDRIVNAFHALSILVDFEEKYSILIDNYLDFERSLLEISLQRSVRWALNLIEFQTLKGHPNRHLMNFLSSCRSYLDGGRSHLKDISQDLGETFTLGTNKQYDENLSYRFMESLRNYVQHRDLGVHKLSFLIDRNEDGGSRSIKTQVYVNIDELRKDGEIKGSVLKELSEDKSKTDLRFLVRAYLSSIAKIHDEVRKQLRAYVDAWQVELEGFNSRFASECPKHKRMGLSLSMIHVDGSRDEINPFPDFILERYHHLVRINSCPKSMNSVYISSQLKA